MIPVAARYRKSRERYCTLFTTVKNKNVDSCSSTPVEREEQEWERRKKGCTTQFQLCHSHYREGISPRSDSDTPY